MSQRPGRPGETLPPDELQRFLYACSHERRSPTTQRIIDGASYGWIHRFIRSNSEDGGGVAVDDNWREPYDADPVQLSEYFKRVAIRLRNTGAFDYATDLQAHFAILAEERAMPWPLG